MPIFFTKKSCNRGGGTTPPQMPLTVKTFYTLTSALCSWSNKCVAAFLTSTFSKSSFLECVKKLLYF